MILNFQSTLRTIIFSWLPNLIFRFAATHQNIKFANQILYDSSLPKKQKNDNRLFAVLVFENNIIFT
ncbi:hypothetical protein A2907_02080 [Candidatus Azambacteria bacterium RIFCSPLOWO2_01_FULL_37_9]|uniref:Uncharacterized protein n=1 Tax=Candidatus Azambacteria bacterium RIFCSPLOWO2_01_FULL_37_9 TaxID=1797297 RepID=A0A1F5C9B6_9BACT|nr:MAG: hypothetical protein A2907_02080 [Candidatus Azambacteria bacterium RIFCSPLOWO2_01_FULL_37_9]